MSFSLDSTLAPSLSWLNSSPDSTLATTYTSIWNLVVTSISNNISHLNHGLLVVQPGSITMFISSNLILFPSWKWMNHVQSMFWYMVEGYPGDLIMPWESETYCEHSAMNEWSSRCKVCLQVISCSWCHRYRLYRQSLEQLRWEYRKMLSELERRCSIQILFMMPWYAVSTAAKVVKEYSHACLLKSSYNSILTLDAVETV